MKLGRNSSFIEGVYLLKIEEVTIKNSYPVWRATFKMKSIDYGFTAYATSIVSYNGGLFNEFMNKTDIEYDEEDCIDTDDFIGKKVWGYVVENNGFFNVTQLYDESELNFREEDICNEC